MLLRLIRTSNDPALAIVRIVLGIVFFAHGAQKVLGWFGGHGFTASMGFFGQMGIPAVFGFLAIAAEFLGGIGLIIGFLSRIAAFGIACNMLVAVAMAHLPHGFFMNWSGQQKGEGYEYHLLVLAITVLVMAKGSGAYSIDLSLSRHKP